MDREPLPSHTPRPVSHIRNHIFTICTLLFFLLEVLFYLISLLFQRKLELFLSKIDQQESMNRKYVEVFEKKTNHKWFDLCQLNRLS